MARSSLLLVACIALLPTLTGCHRLTEPPSPIPLPDSPAMVETLAALERDLAEPGDYAGHLARIQDLLNRRVQQDERDLEQITEILEAVRVASDFDNTVNSRLGNLEKQTQTLRWYATMGRLGPDDGPQLVADLDGGIARVRSGYTARGSQFEDVFVRTRAYVADAIRRFEERDLTDPPTRLEYRRLGALLKVPKSVPTWMDASPGVDDLWKAHQERHGYVLNRYRYSLLFLYLLLCGTILHFIRRGQQGEEFTIRRINGLAAIEEAVGRATEMGKPVLYVSGILDVDNIQTLAGLNILGHVAQKTAEYETELSNPYCWAMALSSAQEVVKESYLKAGKPDLFRSDMCYYMTQDQFAFAAGASGYMLREKPAAAIYMGAFYAESLLLAEVGTQIGSIQIAGTAMVSQLPFFVSACDYTLIGEELFAASAYLSREPTLLGSLKGQDAGKAFIMASLLIGCVLEILISYGWVPPSMTIVGFFDYL